MILVCKHEKTITIVADKQTRGSCRFAPVYVTVHLCVCERVCWRSFPSPFVSWNAQKHTRTCFQACAILLEIPEPCSPASLFLLFNQKPIVQAVCARCHRKQSLKHPLVSIGYLRHKCAKQPQLSSNTRIKPKSMKKNTRRLKSIFLLLLQVKSTYQSYCINELLCTEKCDINVCITSDTCHVRSHLAATEDSGQPRASRPPDVPLCWWSNLSSPYEEGHARFQTKIWSLRSEWRRRRRDGQQVHGNWAHR